MGLGQACRCACLGGTWGALGEGLAGVGVPAQNRVWEALWTHTLCSRSGKDAFCTRAPEPWGQGTLGDVWTHGPLRMGEASTSKAPGSRAHFPSRPPPSQRGGPHDFTFLCCPPPPTDSCSSLPALDWAPELSCHTSDFPSNPLGRYCDQTHFTEQETEPQRS